MIEAIEISQVYENIIKAGSFGNGNTQVKKVELDTKRNVECPKYSDQNERTGHDEMKINSVDLELQENKNIYVTTVQKKGILHLGVLKPHRPKM